MNALKRFITYYQDGLQFINTLNFMHSESTLYDVYLFGLFYDAHEYSEEIKMFTQKCKELYNYRIRFGLIVGKEVKQIQMKYKTYSNYVISRFPNNYEFLD